MPPTVAYSKVEDSELPVPSAWRPKLAGVVEALKNRDFCLNRKIENVARIEQGDAERIASNIDDYGDKLVSLPEDSWKTSICVWNGTYWDILVDLFTLEQGRSDLVLFIHATESSNNIEFKVEDVHVA